MTREMDKGDGSSADASSLPRDGEAQGTPGLLPCPFCGSTKIMTLVGPVPRKWGVMCNACDVWRDDRTDTEAEAIAAWNTRTAPSTATRLREANTNLLGAVDRFLAWADRNDWGTVSSGIQDGLRSAAEEARDALRGKDDVTDRASPSLPDTRLLPCPFCGGEAVEVLGDHISCGAHESDGCPGYGIMADSPDDWNTREKNAERDDLVDALKPFAGLGGGPEIQAYAELEDDSIVYKSGAAAITAGDVRNAREKLAQALGEPVSMTHFRRHPSMLEQEHMAMEDALIAVREWLLREPPAGTPGCTALILRIDAILKGAE